jgi:sugar lactone lactonase YvrE
VRHASSRVELLDDARVELAEGPVWLDEGGELVWTEFLESRLHFVDVSSGGSSTVDVGVRVGSVAPAGYERLIVAAGHGFSWLERNGALEDVARAETAEGIQMNDGKCDAAGRFWAGSFHRDFVRGAGGLHCLEADGTVVRKLEGVTLSNGMGWSPDGETFYYVDSRAGGVDAFDFEVDSGEISNRRRFVELPAAIGDADGLSVDEDGCVWVAMWGGGAVRRFRPDGELDIVIDLPVTQVTSCAFAGPRRDMLVITTAKAGLDSAQRSVQTHAGSVFCCWPGVAGMPVHAYAGLRATDVP